MRLQRMRERRVVVIGSPLVKVVGDIVAARIWRGVFEVDDNVFVVVWRAGDGVLEEKEVAVLRVVVCGMLAPCFGVFVL